MYIVCIYVSFCVAECNEAVCCQRVSVRSGKERTRSESQ